MPQGRGRKGNAPPRKRRQAIETETRVPMTVSTPGNDASTQPVINSETASCTLGQPSSWQPPPYYSGLPPYPYGYFWNAAPVTYATTDANPFTLSFIKGNISVCNGCHNRYTKSKEPPNDLCIRHKEWREFTPEGAEAPKKKFANVYYHCDPSCVWMKCPHFEPTLLDLSEIKEKLQSKHVIFYFVQLFLQV